MKYHKYLDSEFAQKQELRSLIPDETISPGNYVKLLPRPIQYGIELLLGIESTEYFVFLVRLDSHSRIDIHRDYEPVRESCQALLIPLENCEHLTFHWYNSISDDGIVYNNNPGFKASVPFLPVEQALEQESALCNTPMITDIKSWHNVTNTGDLPAVAISIRVFPWSKTKFGAQVQNRTVDCSLPWSRYAT